MRTKLEMMKMDILGMMIAGKNPGLLDKLEKREHKPVKTNPIVELSKLGIKIKQKEN